MDWEWMLFLLIIIIGSIYKLYLGVRKNKDQKALKKHLQTLDKFSLDLDSIRIDGFDWQENVPVDIYGHELDTSSHHFYRNSSSGYLNFKDRYHKDTNIQRFSSRLYIPVQFKDINKIIELTLPLEETILRMKFYLQKQTTVYYQESQESHSDQNNKASLIFDFEFIENGFYKIKLV